ERVVDRQPPHDLPSSVASPATRSWMTRAPPLLRSTPAATIRGRRSQTASRRASSRRRESTAKPSLEYPQRPMVKPRTTSVWPHEAHAITRAPSGRTSRTSTSSDRHCAQKIIALIVWTLLDVHRPDGSVSGPILERKGICIGSDTGQFDLACQMVAEQAYPREGILDLA